ncbi:MAG: HAD-IB family hydrolase, partial [Kiritimatiellaceae bacterium]|nr:HAD-IB family hydrolase [Kiritimatiellaceae bacterium]
MTSDKPTNKLALFDFCDTLVSFQTADRFVHFVRAQERSLKMYAKESLRKIIIRSGALRFFTRLAGTDFHKKLVLWQLKGMSNSHLDRLAECYYRTEIKPALIKESMETLFLLMAQGYKIFLISAGYDAYLKYFAREYQIDKLICTEISFKNGKCQGTFVGEDCYGQRKLVQLKEHLNKAGVSFEETISFSDCISDLPLLQWSKTGVVVRKEG